MVSACRTWSNPCKCWIMKSRNTHIQTACKTWAMQTHTHNMHKLSLKAIKRISFIAEFVFKVFEKGLPNHVKHEIGNGPCSTCTGIFHFIFILRCFAALLALIPRRLRSSPSFLVAYAPRPSGSFASLTRPKSKKAFLKKRACNMSLNIGKWFNKYKQKTNRWKK